MCRWLVVVVVVVCGAVGPSGDRPSQQLLAAALTTCWSDGGSSAELVAGCY